MSEPIAEGWLTTTQAENLTGYSVTYIRQLAVQGKVIAEKVGRDWLINQESLLGDFPKKLYHLELCLL